MSVYASAWVCYCVRMHVQCACVCVHMWPLYVRVCVYSCEGVRMCVRYVVLRGKSVMVVRGYR